MTSNDKNVEALQELAKELGLTITVSKRRGAPQHSNAGKNYRTQKTIRAELLTRKSELSEAKTNWREAVRLSKENAEKASTYKADIARLTTEIANLRKEAGDKKGRVSKVKA